MLAKVQLGVPPEVVRKQQQGSLGDEITTVLFQLREIETELKVIRVRLQATQRKIEQINTSS